MTKAISKTLYALAGALLALLVAAPTPTNASSPASSMVTDGCIIRFTSSTPTILDTGGHTCTDRVTSVSVMPDGALAIHYTGVGLVVSCIAVPDETLAMRGIITGCSMDFTTSYIYFRNVETKTTLAAGAAAMVSPTSNIWVLWTIVPA